MTAPEKRSDFKYIAVQEWIMENIENNVFKYGAKLPSENFLCKKFSISRQTVRNALGGLEKDGVVVRKHGSGTYVAKMLNDVRNKTIGVLTSFLNEYIFPNILLGIEEVCSTENYGINFGVTYNRIEAERRFLERMLESNVSGLLIEGTKTALPNPNIELYREFILREIPIVFIHNYYRELVDVCPCVLLDDIGSTRQLTRYLIEQGHREIAGFFKFDDLQGHRRYAGYAEALTDAGIPVNEDIIGWFSDYTQDTVFDDRSFPVLNAIKNCSAVVCYNDQVASILYHYFYKQGIRVPEDISMVGFDDSFSSPLSMLELTTVKHPQNALGAKAAAMLIELVKSGKDAVAPNIHLMDTDVLLRKSVKKISAFDGNIPEKFRSPRMLREMAAGG